jgi:hypothetical protein
VKVISPWLSEIIMISRFLSLLTYRGVNDTLSHSYNASVCSSAAVTEEYP